MYVYRSNSSPNVQGFENNANNLEDMDSICIIFKNVVTRVFIINILKNIVYDSKIILVYRQ
jgi:hypothetical protein